jgi:hypothetical protein
MRYRIRETGAVVYDNEFRALYPNTSFPAVLTVELLNDFGADPVLEGPQPMLTADQYARYDGVEQTEGTWFTVYTAVDYTPEELAARLEQWRQQTSCTPFQGRIALSDANLLANAEAAVNAADEKTKTAWEYALVWQRSSPMIAALGSALGMTDEQIDDLFKAAQQITA